MSRKVLSGAAVTLLSALFFVAGGSRAWQVHQRWSIAVAVPFRLVRGRLSGFPYRPLQTDRGNVQQAVLVRLHVEASRFIRKTSDDHLRGNASLLLGRPDAAVALL